MINPVHKVKKFVKYAGNEKPADFYISEFSGWLGSGIKDENGVEIFEGDIVKDEYGDIGRVQFKNGCLLLFDVPLSEYIVDLEVIGHIATEGDLT